MAPWSIAYLPILAAPVRTVAWYPLWCDTPDLAAELMKPALCYSGGALILSENGNRVFLTWTQVGQQFGLTASEKSEKHWVEGCLDRIQCSFEDPWGKVRGAVLKKVELYAAADDELGNVVGAKHTLENSDGRFSMWIGTGGDNRIGDSDDLWVSVGVEPDNLSTLALILTLEA